MNFMAPIVMLFWVRCVPRLTGIARCDPTHLAGTADLRLEPDASAAFNGLSHHLMYGAICVPGYPGVTDRMTVNAAIESLRPAVVRSRRPAAT
jgi:hypothetical protein